MKTEGQIAITVFGITGDWAYKKVIPSLWYLWKKGKINNDFLVIGFGRRPLNKKELEEVIDRAVKYFLESSHLKASSNDIKKFISKFSYVQNDFNILKDVLPAKSNKIFYCATPPNALKNIFAGIKKYGLSKETNKYWSRIVIEKPFGENEKSARKLILDLKANFKSNQVYPIDHYLFKWSVQKIKSIGKSELKNITRVNITTNEAQGVESRGLFYDLVGAMRDVGQNHLLMLVAVLFNKCLTTRLNVLRSLKKWDKESLQKDTFRAQHIGYTNIKNVDSNSKTETFFVTKTDIVFTKKNSVPIYLQAGKKLKKERKEVVIVYKDKKRSKVIRINNKVKYVEEYSKALQDIVRGDKSYFVTYEEIEACWKFTDPIVSFWKANLVLLSKYKPGTNPSVPKHLVF
jgi:glucose-6-phosphate 1-dehydrogenase